MLRSDTHASGAAAAAAAYNPPPLSHYGNAYLYADRAAPVPPPTSAAAALPPLLGLHNEGNNCWCNALLQCLRVHPGYRPWIAHYVPEWGAVMDAYDRELAAPALAPSPGACAGASVGAPTHEQLERDAGNRVSRLVDSQKLREHLSHKFYSPKLRKSAISPSAGRMQDASEALALLFGRCVPPSEFFDVCCVRHLEPTDQVFPRLDKSRYTELNSENCLISTDKDWHLALAVPDESEAPALLDVYAPALAAAAEREEAGASVPLQHLLRAFWEHVPAPEKRVLAKYVDHDGQLRNFYCVRERQFLSRHPEHVALVLKRFSFDAAQQITCKNMLPVGVPLQLSLPARRASGGEAAAPYELLSFIVHEGKTAHTGHYVAYVRVAGQWYSCSDARVSERSDAQISRCARHAYICFYGRSRARSSSSASASSLSVRAATGAAGDAASRTLKRARVQAAPEPELSRARCALDPVPRLVPYQPPPAHSYSAAPPPPCYYYETAQPRMSRAFWESVMRRAASPSCAPPEDAGAPYIRPMHGLERSSCPAPSPPLPFLLQPHSPSLNPVRRR